MIGTWRKTRGTAALLICLGGASVVARAEDGPRPEQELVEEDLFIPASDGVKLAARVIRPPGPGPFPLVVINHGSPRDKEARARITVMHHAAEARRFALGGWVAATLLRRGYGATGGPWAEGYGACTSPDYVKAGLASARDIVGAVRHLQKLPFVDKTRVISVGTSAGGFAALATSSLKVPGLVAAINFAGGRGSAADNMI